MTKTGREALNLRKAGHSPEDTAHNAGIALPEVRDLQCLDDEDAELDAHCHARQGKMPIEVGIYKI